MHSRIKAAKSLKAEYLLFFIWPFLAYIRSFFLLKSSKILARGIFLAFFTLIGYTFLPTESADAMSNAHYFEKYVEHGLAYLGVNFNQMINGDAKKELFLDVTSLTVAFFTGSKQVFFALWGFIYGIFFIAIIERLINHYNPIKSVFQRSFLFLMAFALLVTPMEAINGRFWMAHIAYMWVVYEVAVNRSTKAALLGLLIAFIHQGFTPLVILPLMFRFVHLLGSSRNFFLYGLVIIAFIMSESGIQLVREGAEFAGDSYQKHAGGYVSEATSETMGTREPKGIMAIIHIPQKIMFYVLLLLTQLNYFLYRKKIADTKLIHFDLLFSFILLFWAAQTLVSNVPSMGGRYAKVLMGVMIMYNFLMFAYRENQKFKLSTSLFFLIYSLFLVVQLRIWFEFTSALTLSALPWIGMFTEWDISILNLINLIR